MGKLAIDGGDPVRTKAFPTWPEFGKEEEELVLEVIRSGQWGGTGRTKLQAAEEKFAKFQDAQHAISVTNGTLAITIALQAAGVKSGDEVIMPPYTFIATATSALIYGALPVFVDVEEDTLLLDPEKVEAAITEKTKAIVAVHMAGASANMTRLKEIANKHGLALIEDSAQAVGAEWEGTAVGAIGDLGTFSFQSSKSLNSGEGGMITSNNEDLIDRAWSYANVGRVRKGGAWYHHVNVGWNMRMTEMQGALLLAQMARMDEQMQRREKNAKLLTSLLEDIDGVRNLKFDPRVTRHAYHLFMFKIDSAWTDKINKLDFIKKLNAEGIPAGDGYVSLNLNDAVIKNTSEWAGEKRFYPCPISEHLAEKEVVWLTQNLLLGDESDIHDIANAIKKVIASY